MGLRRDESIQLTGPFFPGKNARHGELSPFRPGHPILKQRSSLEAMRLVNKREDWWHVGRLGEIDMVIIKKIERPNLDKIIRLSNLNQENVSH